MPPSARELPVASNQASAASAKGAKRGKLVRMTVEKVSSTDAKNRLNALLADVERTGKTVIITNHGRDVAHLVPANPTPRQFGQMPHLTIPSDFDEPLPDTELARWEGDESP
jgi:prevent-host-death family protein